MNMLRFTVPCREGRFTTLKEKKNISLETVDSHRYLRSLSKENMPFASPNPERMTIHFYKANQTDKDFRGMPVVLNFTDSQSFLKCSRQDEGAILRVEACDKHRLSLICQQDESALAFLFYMKRTMSGQHQFESALCESWFIQVLHQETVQVTHQPATRPAMEEDPSFYFNIHSYSN
ncbi:unnamed protein product [Arctogadus glacialis]